MRTRVAGYRLFPSGGCVGTLPVIATVLELSTRDVPHTDDERRDQKQHDEREPEWIARSR